MADLKPISYIDMLQIMIVENENEIQKNKIMERLIGRQQIRGSKVEIQLGQTLQRIKHLEAALSDLKDIYTEALAQEDKIKI